MDIGVIEIDGVVDGRGQQRLHNLAGAGRTAGMEQQFIVAAGHLQLRPFVQGYHFWGGADSEDFSGERLGRASPAWARRTQASRTE